MFTPTLTGVGERWHLMNPGITLSTHIADIVNLFEFENLEDSVLCGHSFGGWVISGALEEIAPRVAAAVFLDAHVPKHGEMGVDRSKRQMSLREAWDRGDISYPPPPVDEWNLRREHDQAWERSKMTPHPLVVWFQPINLSSILNSISKTYIRATRYPSGVFDEYLKTANTEPNWSPLQIDCGHDVMIDEPTQLAQALLNVARRHLD